MEYEKQNEFKNTVLKSELPHEYDLSFSCFWSYDREFSKIIDENARLTLEKSSEVSVIMNVNKAQNEKELEEIDFSKYKAILTLLIDDHLEDSIETSYLKKIERQVFDNQKDERYGLYCFNRIIFTIENEIYAFTYHTAAKKTKEQWEELLKGAKLVE